MKLEGQSQDCPFCVLSGRICKSRMGRKDGNQMSESYTENEEETREIELALVRISFHKRQKNKPEKGL